MKCGTPADVCDHASTPSVQVGAHVALLSDPQERLCARGKEPNRLALQFTQFGCSGSRRTVLVAGRMDTLGCELV